MAHVDAGGGFTLSLELTLAKRPSGRPEAGIDRPSFKSHGFESLCDEG